MGSLIIKEVVNELLSKGLDKAKVLLLAGIRSVPINYVLVNIRSPLSLAQRLTLSAISAGGVGVLVNVDRVAEQLRSRGHQGVQVRGLADSGWALQRKQHKPGDCTHVLSCGLSDAVKIGFG